MNQAIANLLEKYDLKTQDDYEIAIKEIIHQLALLGLWRSRFYEHASFYGGTALRIFYGLKRFSEDLDFYDLIWYIGQKIPCRLDYLKEKMIQTGHWKREDKLDKNILLQLLQEKLNDVDIEQIKKDVQPFLNDKQELELWGRVFFLNIIESIEII